MRRPTEEQRPPTRHLGATEAAPGDVALKLHCPAKKGRPPDSKAPLSTLTSWNQARAARDSRSPWPQPTEMALTMWPGSNRRPRLAGDLPVATKAGLERCGPRAIGMRATLRQSVEGPRGPDPVPANGSTKPCAPPRRSSSAASRTTSSVKTPQANRPQR